MLFILISYLVLIIINKDVTINSTKNTTILWFNTIFSSMYISLILVDLILLKLKKKSIKILFFLSFILGNPAIARIISNLEINDNNKAKIIASTSYFNPVFLFNTFDFDNMFYISYYLSNIIISILLFKNHEFKEIKKNDNPFINIMLVLLNILGVMIFCSIFINILPFKFINLLHPFIEITSGINKIKYNPYLSLIAINMCGISIHIQNKMTCNFNYFIYLFIRIIITIISLFMYKSEIYLLIILSIFLLWCIIKKYRKWLNCIFLIISNIKKSMSRLNKKMKR